MLFFFVTQQALGFLEWKAVLAGRKAIGIAFTLDSIPLLCHNMTVTIITSALYPDFRDYAASATSFFTYSFNRYLLGPTIHWIVF